MTATNKRGKPARRWVGLAGRSATLARRSALIPQRWLASTAVAAVAVLVLTGCGDAADDPQVASADGATTASSESTEESSTDQYERALEYAECMRENGVDMPDPEPGQNGGFGTVGAPGEQIDDETMQAALDACRDLAPTLERNGKVDPEREEQMLALTECLREHGIDVPDPSGGGGGVLIGPDDDVDREEMEAAMDACRDQLGPPNGALKEREDKS